MLVKRIFIFIIIALTVLSSVNAFLYPKADFLSISNDDLIQVMRPFDYGYSLTEDGNYTVYLGWYELHYFDEQYIDVIIVSNGHTMYVPQLNWCYSIYGAEICNYYFLFGDQAIDLSTIGYTGIPSLLEPIEYKRVQYWTTAYLNAISFKEQLQTNYDDDYGNLFGEEEGGFS